MQSGLKLWLQKLMKRREGSKRISGGNPRREGSVIVSLKLYRMHKICFLYVNTLLIDSLEFYIEIKQYKTFIQNGILHHYKSNNPFILSFN